MGATRRQRQLDELCALCACGAVARAVDLAFEHFALFGRDDAVIDVLAASIERCTSSPRVRRRFEELRRS